MKNYSIDFKRNKTNLKDFPEVWAARRQDNLVSLERIDPVCPKSLDYLFIARIFFLNRKDHLDNGM